MRRPRVVIVGAGITGLAGAAELAPDHEVIVLDRDAIAGDTTARASGVISLPLEPLDSTIRSFASEAFITLDGTGVFEYTPSLAVRLLTDANEAPYAGGTIVDRSALRERFPGVFGPLDGFAGGAIYGGAGLVDPLDLAMTYKHQAEGAGATVIRDRRVEGIQVEDGRVVGVETSLGPVAADAVVYATGWRARDQLLEYVELPIRPMRWNAIVLQHDIAGKIPIGSDPTLQLYWRPMGDTRLLVGGNEHLVDDPTTAPPRVDDRFVAMLTDALANRLAIDRPLRFERADCCPTADAATPDGLPIIDSPPEGPAGLVVAAGFHGRGVMLSPVSGRAIRAAVVGEVAPFDASPFHLDRFADRSADFPYVSHWSASILNP